MGDVEAAGLEPAPSRNQSGTLPYCATPRRYGFVRTIRRWHIPFGMYLWGPQRRLPATGRGRAGRRIAAAGRDATSPRGLRLRGGAGCRGPPVHHAMEAGGPAAGVGAGDGVSPRFRRGRAPSGACLRSELERSPRRERQRAKQRTLTKAHGEQQTSAELELERRPVDVVCLRHKRDALRVRDIYALPSPPSSIASNFFCEHFISFSRTATRGISRRAGRPKCPLKKRPRRLRRCLWGQAPARPALLAADLRSTVAP